MRGRIAINRESIKEAVESLRKGDRDIPRHQRTARLCQHWPVAHLHGAADEARESFRNALDIDALNGPAHDGLANVLRLEGKIDEAMNELRLALRFDPNQPQALATLAHSVAEKGDLDAALKVCLRALELAPTYPMVHNNLGLDLSPARRTRTGREALQAGDRRGSAVRRRLHQPRAALRSTRQKTGVRQSNFAKRSRSTGRTPTRSRWRIWAFIILTKAWPTTTMKWCAGRN